MPSHATPRRSSVARAAFALFDPIPFGCFVAAFIFDIVYARSAEILWMKAAAWLIVIGLLSAVIPRLVNLADVWITGRSAATRTRTLAFWLNLVAIVAAIFNSFVHSRDAYAVMPAGMWLSACTVVPLAIAHVMLAVQPTRPEISAHE